MMISGHKTRSGFERYHMISQGDLGEVAQTLSRDLTVIVCGDSRAVSGAQSPGASAGMKRVTS